MIKLNDNKFYEENPVAYEVLTDWLFKNRSKVPLLQVRPEVLIEVELEDCFLDQKGNFFAPSFYAWLRKAKGDEPDLYQPIYDLDTLKYGAPTLTKKEIAEMVALVEEPEINDPARNI